MERCIDFQPQMLDFVYDLLDKEVSRALVSHLEVCPACQLALREAQAQRRLFAAAARLDFPEVRFLPPELEPVQPALAEPPAVLPLEPARPRRRGLVRRWLAAAAVLLTLAVPSWLTADYLSARRAVDRQEAHIAALREDANKVGGEIDALKQTVTRKQREKVSDLRSENIHLAVTGPRTLPAGSETELQIQALDGNNAEVPAAIRSVRIRDQAFGKTLYEEKNILARGRYRLVLPAYLPVSPNSRVTLELVAAGPGGPEKLLQEDFLLTPPQYLTHLATDKPMYQPGELVRFRSLTLERF